MVHDRLHSIIKANPGIHVRRIALLAGISWNTALHHLRTMESSGVISRSKVEGKVCYFDRSTGAYEGKRATAVLRDQQNLRIAKYILDNPGKNQLQLANELDLATSVIHRRVVRMEEAGLVERLPESRSVRIFPREELPDVAIRAGLLQQAMDNHRGDPRMRVVPNAQPDEVPTPGVKANVDITAQYEETIELVA